MSLAKEASEHSREEARKSHYLRVREQLRQRSKVWRLSHKEQIRRRGKRYRRQVRSGVKVQQQRFRVGTGYVYAGTKGRSPHVGAPPLKVTKVQVV